MSESPLLQAKPNESDGRGPPLPQVFSHSEILDRQRDFLALGEALTSSGYTLSRLLSYVGARAFSSIPDAVELTWLSPIEQPESQTPAAALCDLLACGREASVEVVQRLLGDRTALLWELGLVSRDDDVLWPNLQLIPVTKVDGAAFAPQDRGKGAAYVVHDRHDRRFAPDAVMPPDLSSEMLLRAARLPRAGERWLDIGSGSGVIAVVAAKLGAIALSADINPRACALAQMSGAISGLTTEQFFAVESNLAASVGPGRSSTELAQLHTPFDTVTFNAPLMFGEERAATWLYSAEGVALVRRLMEDCDRLLSLESGAELLIHGQLPRNSGALENLLKFIGLTDKFHALSVRYQWTPDWTQGLLRVARTGEKARICAEFGRDLDGNRPFIARGEIDDWLSEIGLARQT